MPNTKFIVNHKVAESFRINKVKGMFDCQFNEVKKEYNVNIPIEDMDWNVGLIVGASGTGKTTIAKNAFKGYKLFKGYEWNGASILDDFAEEFRGQGMVNKTSALENCCTSAIGRALASCGLGGGEYASGFEVDNAINNKEPAPDLRRSYVIIQYL